VLVRLARGVDPNPALQEDADSRPRMRVAIGDAARREVDPVAAEQPVSLGPVVHLPDERLAVDARGAEVRLVAGDVVHDARPVLGHDALGADRDPQWKYWPPSITIVCPVTKPAAGLQKKTTAPTTSSGTWSRWI